MRTASKLLCAILLFVGMPGCDKSQDRIVGKWKTTGETAMVWEFFENGTVSMGAISGRYSFGDRKRVKIQTPQATSVYQLEFREDRMILQDPSGARIEFTRTK